MTACWHQGLTALLEKTRGWMDELDSLPLEFVCASLRSDSEFIPAKERLLGFLEAERGADGQQEKWVARVSAVDGAGVVLG